MVSSPIQVAVRTRPCEWNSQRCMKTDVYGKPKSPIELSVQANQYTHTFQFEKLLHGTSQEEVFQEIGLDAIDTAMEGVNATIIAYGQTGAGKTHTLSGLRKSFQERGIIPRALSRLFQEATRANTKLLAVSLRYVEIYNEAMVDLLNTSTTPTTVTLVESKDVIIPHGATEIVLQDEQHALDTFFRGEASRVTREHALNRDSSRSHTVCIVQLSVQKDPWLPKVVKSLLTFVDLAGSERVMKTRSDGVVLKEAGYINKSLTFLEQVAIAISEGRQHIPYRSAKLTHLLKHALGGNSKTTFLANIWDDVDHTYETLSTLRFAQRMSQMETAISETPAVDHEATITQYEQQVNTLKAALAENGMRWPHMPPDECRLVDPNEHVTEQVLGFLQANGPYQAEHALSQIDLSRDYAVRAAFCAARLLYQHCIAGHKTGASSSEAPALQEICPSTQACTAPTGGDDAVEAVNEACASHSAGGHASEISAMKACHESHCDNSSVGDALRFFKVHVAVGVEALMQARANEVASTRKRVKTLVDQINSENEKIDRLSTGAGNDYAQGVSEALQHSKAVYRALYDELQQEKQELAQSVDSLNRLKDEFQDRFCSWYKTSYMGRTCSEDVGPCVAGSETAVGGVDGDMAPAHANGENALANGFSQPCRSGKSHPSDYNDESRTFYDAQRKLSLSASWSPNHSKLGHLGKGWRISG